MALKPQQHQQHQVVPIFCQIDCLNRVGFILSIHVLYTKIHCMPTSRNIALKNARYKILKIGRLMKINILLSSRFAFFLHALTSAGELKSADRFCQLTRKTFFSGEAKMCSDCMNFRAPHATLKQKNYNNSPNMQPTINYFQGVYLWGIVRIKQVSKSFTHFPLATMLKNTNGLLKFPT